ncbi:hypothetical protein [Neorhizobium sp. NCHU2750]|uniref:hypothetical protein n=1 Tax=Neorhizobium sp. NCHU2750 TaxID=1825976 RepID=UPI000E72031E|nr:hypothetical protein NCHU2750_23450 [Neorhizobium sp. NCHU2750]
MSNIEDILGPLPEPNKRRKRTRTVPPEERAKKQSPEFQEHLRKIGFQKGRKKTGGTVPTPKETKEFLNGKGLEAAEMMWALANDPDVKDDTRRKALEYILSISVSRAATETKVEVNHTHDIGAMLLEAQRMASKPLIDVTPKLPKVIEGDSE